MRFHQIPSVLSMLILAQKRIRLTLLEIPRKILQQLRYVLFCLRHEVIYFVPVSITYLKIHFYIKIEKGIK